MDITNLVNQFIVTPNGDPNYIGPKGFVFDIIGDEEMMFDSDITDHYTEANYAIQDHIALRPPRFTLTGFVAELSDIFPNSFLNILTTIQSMSAISDYTLAFGAQATQVYNVLAGIASQVGTVVNQAKNIYNTISGSATDTAKQQAVYNKFVTMYVNRVLCTVETPWQTLTKMAIERVSILQRDKDRFVSEFSVTFKQIRTVAQTVIQFYDITFQDGRVSDYVSEASILGGYITGQSNLADGTKVDSNLQSKGFNLPSYADAIAIQELPATL